ncbi:MAG: hypothetical protein DSY37_04630 [Hyperthermus sp.]|nr:MAG: hypothetical protein DSY37_04630 [Hyperthermus sp.]
MRPSQKYLECNASVHRESLIDVAVRVSRIASSKGVKIPLSSLINAIEIASAYLDLAAAESLSLEELVLVFSSAISLRPRGEEALVEAIIETVCGRSAREGDEVFRHIVEDLKRTGSRFGSRVAERDALRMSREGYVRLRLLGIIKGGREGGYVVGRERAKRIASEIARRFGSYNEAFRELFTKGGWRRIIRYLDNDTIRYMPLQSLSLTDLVSLYKTLKTRRARSIVAAVVAEKVRSGRGVNRGNAGEAAEILVGHGLIDEKTAENLLRAEPRTARILNRRMESKLLLKIAGRLKPTNPSLAAEIASSALGLRGHKALAFREAFLHGTGAGGEDHVEAYRVYSMVKNSLLKFLETGNEGYIDMAIHALNTARINNDNMPADIALFLTRAAKTLEEGGDLIAVADLLAASRSIDAYEVFKALYNTYRTSIGDEASRVALRLMQRLWNMLVRGVRARIIRRIVNGPEGERIDTRASLYNMLRLQPPFTVFSKYRRTGGIVLVVDKSASMKRYAFDTLIAAAALAPLIKRLVLFDSTVTVFEGPRILRRKPLEIVNTILSTTFNGYTDIIAAVKHAVQGLPPGKLIIVTDYEQTIPRPEDPGEVLEEIGERGWRIHLFTFSSTPGRELKGIRVYRVAEAKEIIDTLTKISLRE